MRGRSPSFISIALFTDIISDSNRRRKCNRIAFLRYFFSLSLKMCWQCVLYYLQNHLSSCSRFLVWIGNNETEIMLTVAADERKGLPNFSAHTHTLAACLCLLHVCMLKFVVVYNWVCRYETKIIKAKRKCNFNFRCAHAMREYKRAHAHVRSRFVPYVCIVLFIFLLILFHFRSDICFFSFQFRSCYLHSTHTHHCCTLFVYIVFVLLAFDATFICNRKPHLNHVFILLTIWMRYRKNISHLIGFARWNMFRSMFL